MCAEYLAGGGGGGAPLWFAEDLSLCSPLLLTLAVLFGLSIPVPQYKEFARLCLGSLPCEAAWTH